MKLKKMEFSSEAQIVKYFYHLEVDPSGINIMKNKLSRYNIEIRGIRPPAALILKQECLSIGAELAIPKNFIVSSNHSITGTVLLMASLKHINILIKKIRKQQFSLDILSNLLTKLLQPNKQLFWKFTNKNLDCSDQFHIMGIINVTPDSFYDGGKYNNSLDNTLEYAESLITAGADILDLGGESSRPYANPVIENEELNRVIPVIKELRKKYPCIPISIDSVKYNVIKAALDEGADIINNISNLSENQEIAELAAHFKAGLVIMHSQGSPLNMQESPSYSNLINEIYDYFDYCLNIASNKGVSADSAVIDPGIGFGKSLAHNIEILRRLNEFSAFDRPLLIGLSNKSFMGKLLNLEVSGRVITSAAASVICLNAGVSIFRTHNPKETNDALKLAREIFKFDKYTVNC